MQVPVQTTSSVALHGGGHGEETADGTLQLAVNPDSDAGPIGTYPPMPLSVYPSLSPTSNLHMSLMELDPLLEA